jgi:F420-non-reducing hydrogenase large subunit
MATTKVQAAYEAMHKTLGGKPVHHTLANHWGRATEMICGPEQIEPLINAPQIISQQNPRP